MEDGDRAAQGTLTGEQVAALLGAAGEKPAGLRIAALAALLYHACPRLGVALAMDTEDVDLTGARAAFRGRREWEVTLDLDPLARLSRWLACRRDMGIAPGPVFCTFGGSPLDASYVRRALASLGRESGVAAPVSAEALRRAGVARLVAAGIGDDELQQHLDHGRVGVTVRYRRRLDEHLLTGLAAALAAHPADVEGGLSI